MKIYTLPLAPQLFILSFKCSYERELGFTELTDTSSPALCYALQIKFSWKSHDKSTDTRFSSFKVSA